MATNAGTARKVGLEAQEVIGHQAIEADGYRGRPRRCCGCIAKGMMIARCDEASKCVVGARLMRSWWREESNRRMKAT